MIKKLFVKYQELIRYVFFGALTTAVSLGVYFLCTRTFLDPNNPLQMQIANVLSWIAAVSFAYVTNRRFVFESRNRNVLMEAASFFLSRLGTLGMDMGLMFLGCTVLKLDDRLMKLVVQVVVLAANYLLSKFLVFRAKSERAPDRQKRSGLFLSYTLLFAVTAAAVFLPFVLNGKSFIWCRANGYGDGLYQHFNVFIYLGQYGRQVLRTLFQEHRLVLPMWDFAIGMGGDVITTLSYYGLGNPFSLLTLFFRPETAEYGYTLSILLRMYCAGLAFIAYSRKMNCTRIGSLCGSLAYVFCCYLISAAPRHPFFIDPLIWLPLVYLGVEKLLRHESPAAFILAVFVSAISNFYFFYVIVLLTVLYVLLRGFEAVQWKPGALIRLMLRVAGLSLIGVAMAAALLLPSVMAMLGSSRHTNVYSFSPLYPLREYLNYSVALFSTYHGSNWTHIGVAPIALVAAAMEFLRRKRELWPRILLILYVIFLLFPVFGYIFNGFGYVTNRWVFAYSLLICFLMARNLDGSPFSRLQKLLLACLAAASLAALVVILIVHRSIPLLIALAMLFLSALFVLAADLLRPLFEKKDRRLLWTRLWRTGVILLTVLGSAFNGICKYSSHIENYVAEFTDAGTALSQLEGGDGAAFDLVDDDEFYRFDTGQQAHINSNYALHKGVSATSVYWSILPKYYSEAMGNWLSYDKILDKFDGLQSRTMLLPFACVKYFTTSPKRMAEAPYGFTELRSFQTENGTERILYQTENVLPLGYTYDRCITQEAYLRMTPVQRQQAMLYAAIIPDGANTTLPAAAPAFTDHEIPYTISCSEKAELGDRQITAKKRNATVTLHASCPANEELYLLIEGLTYRGSSSYLGIKAETEGFPFSRVYHYTSKHAYAHGRTDYLLNLHISAETRDEVAVTLGGKGTYTYDRMVLVSQPMTGFEQALDALRQDALENVRMDANRVSGDIDLAKEKVLCLSIPYADGWRLRVDGTPAALLRVNDLYMGAILQPGQHRIELQYTTPYLRAGLVLSAVGFAVFAALLLLRRKQKHTPEKE